MGKFQQGIYQVQNPEKYVGKKPPTFRSSWERHFCQMCDTHPNVVKWASENIRIPYRNPITNKMSNYVPDFMIQYVDKHGNQMTELVEIKPSGQTLLENARTNAEKQQVVINSAKWASAQAWCEQHGIRFRIVNEQHIFSTQKKRNPKKRVAKSRIPKRRK